MLGNSRREHCRGLQWGRSPPGLGRVPGRLAAVIQGYCLSISSRLVLAVGLSAPSSRTQPVGGGYRLGLGL